MAPHVYLQKLLTPHEWINTSSVNDVTDDMIRDGYINRIIDEDKQFQENEEIRQHKEKCVEELKNIILDWICQIYHQSDLSCDSSFMGDLLVYGSFLTGVDSNDGDIDTIVIAPHWVNRERHFFVSLPVLLKSNPSVENLYAVPDAIVPLLKFKYNDIQFDMVFASILEPSSPLSISTPVDEKSHISLNGLKAAEYFEQIFRESRKNRMFLRAIKLWANNKGIYGGVTGYLGGISWSILACKIIQLYPYYSLSQLMERFFFIYSQWKWTDMVVRIENEPIFDKLFKFDSSTPQSMMTIMTPVYPSLNSAHNVSISTLKIMQEQFQDMPYILNRISKGQGNWKEIFSKVPFFDLYNQYLEIKGVATNMNELCAWKGHIESRLRKLTKLFEDPKYMEYFEVHLLPKSFYLFDESQPKYQHSASFFFGIIPNSFQIQMEMGGKVYLTPALQYFATQLEGTSPFIFVPDSLNLCVNIYTKNQIPQKIRCQL